jgi:predicted acyltransferase
VGASLFADTLYLIRWTGPGGVETTLWEWLFQTFYASWLPCELASLAFAVMVVIIFCFVAYAMDRRGIYLKV